MQETKVVRIPITSKQRWKNSFGKTAVSCEVSERWLQFSETFHRCQGGEFLTLDVMTIGADENDKKICQLIVTREDLLTALSNIKWESK